MLGDAQTTGEEGGEATVPLTSSVADLQRYLTALAVSLGDPDLEPGGVDGIDGANTRRALARLRSRTRSSSTGSWTPDDADATVALSRTLIADLKRLYQITD